MVALRRAETPRRAIFSFWTMDLSRERKKSLYGASTASFPERSDVSPPWRGFRRERQRRGATKQGWGQLTPSYSILFGLLFVFLTLLRENIYIILLLSYIIYIISLWIFHTVESEFSYREFQVFIPFFQVFIPKNRNEGADFKKVVF